ncbi:hypothetical protein ABET52_03310 [Saccharococcus caldoxylosilyticus]|uniref:hypothetical protein n=1 Tax=Saccharococcus caldoxylosilyticus TaxID=81408 RepID=UPI00168B2F45|nr:hypothetical protein [Parageobacillus caldoxylosilyticus]QNU37590.1 hypothetical protein IC801_18150 [Geobacillus sp. 44B]BDG35343.1 hypothetical protein PcaKH15_12490 [Parageobacillus caldoxylosilyticus]BDG39120.1 hypothetical protein PcaKH16_12590 [Parageobacillus caldoxylosilyticus]
MNISLSGLENDFQKIGHDLTDREAIEEVKQYLYYIIMIHVPLARFWMMSMGYALNRHNHRIEHVPTATSEGLGSNEKNWSSGIFFY